MKRQTLLKSALTAGALVLAGCGGDSGDSNAQGRLSLAITDAPVDVAESVVVEFTGVSVKPVDGDAVTFEFDTPRQIDLLDLQGGETELLLDDVTVDAGDYAWIRLSVNAGRQASDSFIALQDGSVHPLFIPSGNQSGLKLVRGFTVPANASADFTIDFDLRKSVVNPGSSGDPYILRPTLRLVDNTEVGAIAGTVDAGIAADADCSPAVYAYDGSDVTPDDTGSATEPVASGLVGMNDATGVYEYRIAFLAAGDYTVALTCDADADQADADDDIAFDAQQNVTVTTDETATADF